MDCGAASLRIICASYGKYFTQERISRACRTAKNGVSMLAINDAGESLGLRTMGVRVGWDKLERLPLPCILHLRNKHFVVLYKVKWTRHGEYYYISDPARGLLRYERQNLKRIWLNDCPDGGEPFGFALLFETTPEFYRQEEGDKKAGISMKFLAGYFKPYTRNIVQIFAGMLVGSMVSLIMPFLTQGVVDAGIGNGDIGFVIAILIAQVMLVMGQMANTLIRNWLMLHVTSRTSIALISDFLGKLMRLPLGYFDSKNVGDILQRIKDHHRIQDFLTGSFIGIFMAIVNFTVYSAVMCSYDLLILLIFLAGSALYVMWIVMFLRKRRKLDYMRFQAASRDQSKLVEMINGMQDIKINNAEKKKRWQWENLQVELYRIRIKGLALGQAQQVGSTFIDQTKNVLISYIAARAVISGYMTLGMMMAMQYIIGQLNGPISQFVNFIQSSQDAKISLERLNEIHLKPDEEPKGVRKMTDIPRNGDIVLDEVVFQYDGPHSEKVLDRISLTIKAGQVTAIVGSSGSGKTTLLKLILGFYEPTQGEVKLGERRLCEYSNHLWRACYGAVLQEGYIFNDTIAGNIAISDENIDMQKVRAAVRIANLERFVESLPLKYETRIGPQGKGLSSGQKQRLLIARAVYKDSPYFIFDEATNTLDANNEKTIMENLRKFFKNRTVVIVAHRLSTVKNADKIVTLEHGKIVEEGTHNELLARKGNYYRLVVNQLEIGG